MKNVYKLIERKSDLRMKIQLDFFFIEILIYLEIKDEFINMSMKRKAN